MASRWEATQQYRVAVLRQLADLADVIMIGNRQVDPEDHTTRAQRRVEVSDHCAIMHERAANYESQYGEDDGEDD